MSTFLTRFQEWRLKRARINILLRELYNLEIEVAYSVELISRKRDEVERYREVIIGLEADLPHGDAKLQPDAQKKYKEIQQELAGFRFKLNTVEMSLKKLYEEISEKAYNIEAIKNTVEFNRATSLNNVPKLPFIEINGTRYQAENNAPVKDKNGIFVLYMAPAQRTNGDVQTTEK